MNASLEVLRRFGRRVLPFPVFRKLSECYTFAIGASQIGFTQYRALNALTHGKTGKELKGYVEFHLPSLEKPISVRPGTTDAGSVIHTALRHGYGRYLPGDPVNFIIDAGANIGDTASWYLTRYPGAHLVALEPDSGNFAMLQRNCLAYGPRAHLLNCGLWSRQAYLKVTGDGQMESGLFVVETAKESDSDCVGVSPLEIMARFNAPQIDIFKCDIEGAESEVFGSNCDEWLSRTRSIFIEIHNRHAYEIVMKSTQRHSFRSRVYRDLHVFHRQSN
jgi:FkbM family methyltransferase